MILSKLLNNDQLIQHYSDEGYILIQIETGIKYLDPVDIYPCPYTYVETQEKPEIIVPKTMEDAE